jgi:hypothetical protein
MVRGVDGTLLVLLEKDERHSETMKKMSVQDEARDGYGARQQAEASRPA